MSADTSILVARQLAALRRQGLGTLDALALVAAPLPPGELRTACERALAGLRAGVTGAQPTASPLEQACARGDATGEGGFTALAQALEARDEARRSLEGAVRVARTVLAGPLLLGALLGWALAGPGGLVALASGADLPDATQAVLAVLDVLRWVGVPLAGLVAWALPRWVSTWAPGAREFAAAQALLEGEAPARLQPAEARFLEWRRALVGAPAAGRELAEALLLDARARVSAFAVLAPLAAAVLGLVVLQGLLSALYLPVFTIARSIK